MENVKKILKLLPGFNCGACGYKRCDTFAEDILKGKSVNDCPFLLKEEFKGNLQKINDIKGSLKETPKVPLCSSGKLKGLLDGYEADFLLDPLPKEHSCRETLIILSKTPIKMGDHIKYRPLACPIPHFAEIIGESHGMYVVHLEGPCNRFSDSKKEYKEVGIALIAAFEGIYRGKPPEVGKTVKFIPTHCMMQKVHSGVVVEVEGNRVLIEGIDLKVW
ncbi:Fe-S cluster domain protein [Methanococcus vannielii SB]|jgi:uncharacterized Fe-S cluster-containing protein|uniref:Fe-S cluster domain protein n=1 Tax=Methanococcus vannielii (strain ATCC 35089 / DSM 1224 / JCM 13029 / OCM 148 / SB) TaxID=406327 RepID=A6URQ7_METVS|nr:(Fe-S)-binding protein [Methanococcus vannielii]ABR55179.1 Fe-S cluster domain protein [Methanococcus vannielii SB]